MLRWLSETEHSFLVSSWTLIRSSCAFSKHGSRNISQFVVMTCANSLLFVVTFKSFFSGTSITDEIEIDLQCRPTDAVMSKGFSGPVCWIATIICSEDNLTLLRTRSLLDVTSNHLFISSSSATTTAATSFLYYVMYVEARFYDYLASSDVKIK